MRATLAEMEKTVRQRERDNAETQKGHNAETQRRRDAEDVNGSAPQRLSDSALWGFNAEEQSRGEGECLFVAGDQEQPDSSAYWVRSLTGPRLRR